MQQGLDDPAVAGTEHGSQAMGRGTFEQAVDRFGNFDLLVRTWDLARATGGDERLEDRRSGRRCWPPAWQASALGNYEL